MSLFRNHPVLREMLEYKSNDRNQTILAFTTYLQFCEGKYLLWDVNHKFLSSLNLVFIVAKKKKSSQPEDVEVYVPISCNQTISFQWMQQVTNEIKSTTNSQEIHIMLSGSDSKCIGYKIHSGLVPNSTTENVKLLKQKSFGGENFMHQNETDIINFAINEKIAHSEQHQNLANEVCVNKLKTDSENNSKEATNDKVINTNCEMKYKDSIEHVKENSNENDLKNVVKTDEDNKIAKISNHVNGSIPDEHKRNSDEIIEKQKKIEDLKEKSVEKITDSSPIAINKSILIENVSNRNESINVPKNENLKKSNTNVGDFYRNNVADDELLMQNVKQNNEKRILEHSKYENSKNNSQEKNKVNVSNCEVSSKDDKSNILMKATMSIVKDEVKLIQKKSLVSEGNGTAQKIKINPLKDKIEELEEEIRIDKEILQTNNMQGSIRCLLEGRDETVEGTKIGNFDSENSTDEIELLENEGDVANTSDQLFKDKNNIDSNRDLRERNVNTVENIKTKNSIVKTNSDEIELIEDESINTSNHSDEKTPNSNHDLKERNVNTVENMNTKKSDIKINSDEIEVLEKENDRTNTSDDPPEGNKSSDTSDDDNVENMKLNKNNFEIRTDEIELVESDDETIYTTDYPTKNKSTNSDSDIKERHFNTGGNINTNKSNFNTNTDEIELLESDDEDISTSDHPTNKKIVDTYYDVEERNNEIELLENEDDETNRTKDLTKTNKSIATNVHSKEKNIKAAENIKTHYGNVKTSQNEIVLLENEVNETNLTDNSTKDKKVLDTDDDDLEIVYESDIVPFSATSNPIEIVYSTTPPKSIAKKGSEQKIQSGSNESSENAIEIIYEDNKKRRFSNSINDSFSKRPKRY